MQLERGARQKLRTLLQLLDRGIVSGGDADEMIHLLKGALSLTGVVITDDWSYQGWNRTAGITAEWMQTYEQVNHHDPSVEILSREPAGRWWLLHRDAEADALQTPLFEAFKKHDFVDAAVSRLPSPIAGQLVLGFYRHRGSARFDEDDRLWLSLLAPHLQGALGTRRILAACDATPDENLDGALQRIETYATIGYPSRELTWSPGAEQAWLQRHGPPGGHDRNALTQLLLRASDRFLHRRLGATTAQLDATLRADFALVPPGRRETHRVVAILLDEREGPRGTCGPLNPAELLLSPRQREVARRIARGRSATEVAAELGIAASTVRHHLRAVYRRLGVHRRAELASLLHAT